MYFPTATPYRVNGSFDLSVTLVVRHFTSDQSLVMTIRRIAIHIRRRRSWRQEKDLLRHWSTHELSSPSADLSSPAGQILHVSVSISFWVQLNSDILTSTQAFSAAQFTTRVSRSLINPVCSRPTKENIHD